MSTYWIRIVQIFKTTRSIEIDVEAEDETQALEEVSSGAIDTPEFDNPRWLTGWDLQNEEVEPA